MRLSSTVFSLLSLLVSTTCSYPFIPSYLIRPGIPTGPKTPFSIPRDAQDPIAQLLHIMPSASSCSSGAPSAGPNECATATQAIGPLIASFQRYNISSAGEQAAIIAWIALESAELKYNVNHFPGNPGQGTRVMLMPPFIAKYVASMPQMAGEAAQAGNDPVKMLGLVLDDGHSFGAGAWFVSSQCTPEVRRRLAEGTEEGWSMWISGCVGTTVTDQRKQYWVKAKEALNVA